MRNFKVTISYDGTAYHGFQRQDNAYTIQQAVEEAIEELTKEKVSIVGCSRTDTGVHANEFVFNVNLESSITERGIIYGLNGLLPDDIAVLACEIVPCDFHARYNCKGKEYIYIIHNSEIKNPFYRDYAYRHWYPLKADVMHKAAQDFVGTHDFKSFCSTACTKENTVRTIYSFDVAREGDRVIFKVSGDGFLYNMVRIMVGTLVFISDGKIPPDAIPQILEGKNRVKAGKTVMPSGLYLNRVFY